MNSDRDIISQNLIEHPQQIESDDAFLLLHKSDTSSLSEHNEQYTELLKAYVLDFKLNTQEKRKNKKELFLIAKYLLFWVPATAILFMCGTLFCLAFGIVEVYETLPGLITSLAALIGTFMVVPQMITKYLFNKKEEDHLSEIIGKIQEYDRDIRGDL